MTDNAIPDDTSPGDDADAVPKGTLFCPDCGRRGRIDGDWRVEVLPERTRYRCPNCEATVATRPPD